MGELTIDGRRLAYEETGGMAPLLLVHGFPLDHSSWAPQLEVFGRTRRVLAPDLAGFGDSEGGHDSLEAHADDLARLLDHLGVPRVVLAGLSMGGYIALAMWRRHPERIAGLVLADTRSAADSPEARSRRAALAEKVLAEGVTPLLGTVRGGLLSAAAPQRVVDAVTATISRQRPAGVAAALAAMAARPDSGPALTTINVPTLVIVGTEDTITPPADSEALAAAIGGGTLARVPRAGHLSNLEEPGAFNAALRAFLEEVDGGGR
jgi:3-oxoadipate enol-lactonase